MSQLYTRRNIIAGLLILLAFISFFVFNSYRNISRVIREKEKVDVTLQSLRALEDVMDDMQDIETGQRGYVISGNKEFLTPYYTAVKKLAGDTLELKALFTLYPNREPAFRQLLKLVREKTKITEASVKVIDDYNQDSAYKAIQFEKGNKVMDSIRTLIISFENEDRIVLQGSISGRAKAAWATAKLFISLTVIFVTGLIIVFWRIGRGLKFRDKYERQISYLAGLTEKTSDAIFSTDLEGIIRSWNKGAEDIYGHTKEEAIGKFSPEITKSGKTKVAVNEMLAKVPQQGSHDLEVLNHNKKGEEIYCLASVTALKNEKGEITGYVTILRDISERKKTEQLLEKFNKELTGQVEEKAALITNILERVSDGFYSLDEKWNFTYMNNIAGEIMNCRPEGIIGKNLWKEYPDAVYTSIYKTFIKAFDKQQYQQVEFYYPPYEKWFMVHIDPSPSGISVFFRNITEIKKAEEEIRHSNERFEMISRTTNDAIWEWNLETGEMLCNETYQQLYGLKMTDPVQDEKEWENRIHPDDRAELIKKQVDTLASDTNIFITEYRFKTEKDGYRNIYDRSYIVRNDEGKAVRILGSMMDVTEGKKAEAALQESEEKYRSMIEQASDSIFIMNNEARYVDVNPACCLMIGYSRDEMINMPATNLLLEGHIPIVKWKNKELKSGKTVYMERKLKRKNGDIIDVEASYKMLLNGHVLAIARDVTEKRKAEEAIRASEETRKLIMNSALDAIVCIDKTGAIIVWTPQAERIFGWKESEAIGKKLTETIIPEQYKESHIKGMKNYLQTGKGPVLNRLTELRAINRQGKEFPIELSIIPIQQGESEFFCAFIRDITERKEAAEKIVKEKELSETAINSLPGIFYIFDADRKFLKWNKNFETVSGYTASELVQMPPVNFFADEDKGLVKRTVEEVFHKGSAELEARLLTKTGNKIPYFFTGQAINYEGKPCMLGTGIDIAELRKTQQTYSTLVNTVDGIVWEADAQTFHFSFVSQQAERLLGYPVERWINESSFWADHIHPEDRSWAVGYCSSCTKQKKAHEFEYRMIAADGKIHWLRDIVSVIVENDKPVLLRGIMVDITEQKKSDEEIVKSNARFQIVSKATSDIVWDWDLVNDEIWWNDNYYSNLGYKKNKEIVHIDEWFNNIHPDEVKKVKTKAKKAFEGKDTIWQDAYRFLKADGSYLNFLDRGFIMRDKEGKAIRMIGSMVDMTPVYEAQRIVAESENRMRTIINSEPQCIKLLDKNGLLQDMNPAGLAMIEADSLEQVKGHPLLDIVDEEYRKDFRQLTHDIFKGKSGTLLFKVTGMKGTKRWLETHAVPMKNAEGDITALLGVTIDVTDKRNAEEELRKSEEKYRTLVERAVDAIALYDATGKILDVNTGSVNLLGYSKEELMKMSLPDILTPEEINVKPVRYDVLQTGESTVKQRKMRRKDNSIVETEVRSQQLPDGRFLSVIRDLTEREKAQQQIEQEKELSDKLIDSLPGVFYWYDENRKFLRWNKQFEIVTGYSAKEIARMHPVDFFGEESRKYMIERINDVFLNGVGDAETDFVSKDGSKHPYYFKALRIIIEGKPSLLGTGIDISDRKKAEQRLDESYRAIRELTGHLQNIREEERTHIAREIHDELGQQLTVLKMDVSWLNKKIGSSDDAIKEKMKSLLAMLDETVKSVRRISSELRPSLLDDLGLIAAIEWQLAEFEKRSGIRTNFISSGEEITLSESVKTALFRILQESLTNVARHSGAKNVEILFVREADSCILSIADNGRGYNKEKAADIRTLGILGMKERTSMIGGTYEIVSILGKGTTVTVKVPFTNN